MVGSGCRDNPPVKILLEDYLEGIDVIFAEVVVLV
jgi:hypothetical protein